MLGINAVVKRCYGEKSSAQILASLIAGSLALTVISSLAGADETVAKTVTDAAMYETGKSSFRKRCSRCHGVNMVNPGVGIFDLRSFPRDDKTRFVESVTHGKNAMPSWQDVLQPADIEALWSYVSNEASQASP